MSIKEQIQDIQSLEFQLFEQKLSLAIEKAYKQGVHDGQSMYRYPEVLKQEHLVEILQVELPTVRKIVAQKDFPKMKNIRARYPRDEVFAWINRNSTDFGKSLLHFKTG